MSPPEQASKGAATAQSLQAMGQSVLGALIGFVPRALKSTLRGALGGFFLCGFLGLALAVAGFLITRHSDAMPRFLGYLNLAWVPFALAWAGAYVGAANGFSSTLADEVRRRGLGVRLFGLLKPACTLATRQFRARGGEPQSLAGKRVLLAEVESAISKQLVASDAAEEGGGFERYLARRSRKLLCLTFVRTLVQQTGSANALESLETLGARHTEDILIETIEDFFQGQMMVAVLLGVLATFAPTLVSWIATSI